MSSAVQDLRYRPIRKKLPNPRKESPLCLIRPTPPQKAPLCKGSCRRQATEGLLIEASPQSAGPPQFSILNYQFSIINYPFSPISQTPLTSPLAISYQKYPDCPAASR